MEPLKSVGVAIGGMIFGICARQVGMMKNQTSLIIALVSAVFFKSTDQ
jgi:hypothetical protein